MIRIATCETFYTSKYFTGRNFCGTLYLKTVLEFWIPGQKKIVFVFPVLVYAKCKLPRISPRHPGKADSKIFDENINFFTVNNSKISRELIINPPKIFYNTLLVVDFSKADSKIFDENNEGYL